jgi:flagellar basal-body rod protein FlgC
VADELSDIFAISSSALDAQKQRMKVVSENIANAASTSAVPGGKPYQRQIITFKKEFDKAIGAYKVQTQGIKLDQKDFTKKYDPANPAADTQGYVLMPNVNPVIEMMDMNDASHNYQANLDALDSARSMVLRTIGLLQ